MRRHSLVVRAWVNDEGQIQGQLSDPLTGWRQSFAASEELWRAIARVLDAASPPSLAADTDSDPKE